LLDKFAIAAALQEIGALLELKGGDSTFKARAYQRGARSVAGLSVDPGKLIEQDRLTSIAGIGNALASQIKELYLTGSSSVLKNLRQQFPPGIIELSRIPGLSINKIRSLHEALGITSVSELKAAVEAGRVRKVKGFGGRTEEKLLESITNHQASSNDDKLVHIHHAQHIGEQILHYLRTSEGLQDASVAGSLRRWKETVDDVHVVASTNQPSGLIEYFLRFPLIVQVLQQSDNACNVLLADGTRAAVIAARPRQYLLTLLFETGSAAHINRLRQLSKVRNLSLNNRSVGFQERGVKQARTRRPKKRLPQIRSEADVYRYLDLQYVPPELREDEGEIEAALARKLSEDLVALADIQGMVHCHTTYSDGKNTIEEMARAAEAMGMKYLTITDHSPTASYAGGVTADRLRRQWDEIAEVQERVGVRLLKGTESDIVASGALDYPDSILEQFDVIVASIHSRYKMDSKKMTERLLTAMRQPVFKIWGHALGRLIGRRPPFDCDVERVLDAVSESRAAIEINGDPYRLDMEPRWIREARKRKIRFVISVDAHSTGALNNLKYGVGIARRGWVRKSEVLNTLGVRAFVKAVRPVS
jgi:DNA polymerase (family X)